MTRKRIKDNVLDLAPNAQAIESAPGCWEIRDGETVLGIGQNARVAWDNALFKLKQQDGGPQR